MSIVKLQSVDNVREMGGIPVGNGRMLKHGLIYRGSALSTLSPEDAVILFDRLGIRTVIDVRCGWERAAKPDAAYPGIENLFIPYFDQELVGVDYTKSAPGTIAIGHDFACDPLDFYAALANELTVAQMKRAIHAIFSRAAHGSPVYIHCSGGKDRAGATMALVLTVLGASREDIFADYELTNIDRDAHIEKTYRRFLRLCQGDEEFAWRTTNAHRARRENLIAFFDAIERRYQSMDSFIAKQLEIDGAMRKRLHIACSYPQARVLENDSTPAPARVTAS